MDNLRNLFGQVSTLASSKSNSSMSGPSGSSASTSSSGSQHANLNPGERQRSLSGDFAGLDTHQNRAMKQFKTADRDSYYYIMWRS